MLLSCLLFCRGWVESWLYAAVGRCLGLQCGIYESSFMVALFHVLLVLAKKR